MKGYYVLVPSLGILLFNITITLFNSCHVSTFSSPLWGFFYLINMRKETAEQKASSRPLSGDFFI